MKFKRVPKPNFAHSLKPWFWRWASRLPIVVPLSGVLLFPALPLFSAQAPSREELLFMEVPTVVTPARREQPLTKAPSTTTVITAEEIRRSGATNLPDLFRNVPGIDFFRISASDVNITARGLNTRLAHRMQVYIDGRAVYEDFLNLVFWHQLPVSFAGD